MTWFPQSAAGSLVQLPLRRRTVWRAITNHFESGERISLPDRNGGRVEWTLAYHDLSDAEATAISNFFRIARGAFGTFAFADPGANLLGWSEDLSRPDWQRGLLSVTGGVAGPDGTNSAASLTNLTSGAQGLTQTLALPGEYATCFSVYLRAASPVSVTLRRGSAGSVASISARWKRYFLTGPVPGEDNASFSLELAPGSTVEVWGLQAEAGPYPSQYRPTADASGIYERTSFASDELAMTATGVGLYSCEFTLISKL